MNDWKLLADVVSAFAMEEVSFSESILVGERERWTLHNAEVFEILSQIIALPLLDNVKEERLRLYLMMRWFFIKLTPVDYTFYPNFPANNACLRVALALQKQDESIFEILMPGIVKMIGDPGELLTLKDYEEAHDNINLGRYLTGTHSDVLIDVISVLNYSRFEPERLFSNQPSFALTAEDKKNICLLSPDVARCFSAIKTLHDMKFDRKPSFATFFRELIVALRQASRRNTGSETEANLSECRDVILKLYEYWMRILRDEKYQSTYRYLREMEIFKDVINQKTYYLQGAVLSLFLDVSGADFDVQEAVDLAIAYKNNIMFRCADQFSNLLEEVLIKNPMLETLPLPDCEEAFEKGFVAPTETMLDITEEAFLASRVSISSSTRSQYEIIFLTPIFRGFSNELIKLNFHKRNFIEAQGAVHDGLMHLSDLPHVLSLLPQLFWPDFFRLYASRLTLLFMMQQDIWQSIFYCLKRLPLNTFGQFFTSLQLVESISTVLSVKILPSFFDELPEASWPALYAALKPLLVGLFASRQDLVDFFRILILSPHAVKIGAYFIPDIELYLDRRLALDGKTCESAFGQLLISFPPEFWSIIFKILNPVFVKTLHSANQLNHLLGVLDTQEERITLLTLLKTHFSHIVFNRFTVVGILNQLPTKNWKDFFQFLPQAFFEQHLSARDIVFNFILEMDFPEKRLICAQAIAARVVFSDQIDFVTLMEILKPLEHCKKPILLMFQHQFPQMIREFLITFKTKKTCDEAPSDKMKKIFAELLEVSLPYLLNPQYLFSLVPRDKDMGLLYADLLCRFQLNTDSERGFVFHAFFSKINALLNYYGRERAILFHLPDGMDKPFFKALLEVWDLLPRMIRRNGVDDNRPPEFIPFTIQSHRFLPAPSVVRSAPVLTPARNQTAMGE